MTQHGASGAGLCNCQSPRYIEARGALGAVESCKHIERVVLERGDVHVVLHAERCIVEMLRCECMIELYIM